MKFLHVSMRPPLLQHEFSIEVVQHSLWLPSVLWGRGALKVFFQWKMVLKQIHGGLKSVLLLDVQEDQGTGTACQSWLFTMFVTLGDHGSNLSIEQNRCSCSNWNLKGIISTSGILSVDVSLVHNTFNHFNQPVTI
jgi:hypothetical protein